MMVSDRWGAWMAGTSPAMTGGRIPKKKKINISIYIYQKLCYK
jgi:hypothetical protein